jgi:phosphatidylinositol alpha-mannosyltransferase
MRIGMVCPYSFDVPGGVQSHVLQLAEVMRARGQHVSVLAPASPHVELPDYVVSAGRAVPIPYNGSVARIQVSPAVHGKVRRWLTEGDFDVLHLHEPNAPSVSMWALRIAEGPIVATFHTSTTKSLTLSVVQGLLRPMQEKIVGRIAVSDLARRWQMEALGSDAVEIPNGVDVAAMASGPLLDGYPRPAKTVLFLGRYDEPRKGMAVLIDALPSLVERFPGLQVLIVGRGDEAISDFSVWWTMPPRRLRCAAPTSTVHRILAGKASGSCWSRPWRPVRRSWPAICMRSGRCSATAKPGAW